MITEDKLQTAMNEAKILGYFKTFCEKYREVASKQKLRNTFSRVWDKENVVKNLFSNEFNIQLSDSEARRMELLIEAFLKKSTFRRPITRDEKLILLKKQHFQCSFCGRKIDLSSHADHIIPFKFVGDELKDNLQMLCEHCNSSKNASLDYEIRFLLHTI